MEFDVPSWGNEKEDSKSSVVAKRKGGQEELIKNQKGKEELKSDGLGKKRKQSMIVQENKSHKINSGNNQKPVKKQRELNQKKEQTQKKQKKEEKFETMKEKLKQKMEEQKSQKKLSPLQEKMKERLAGGQFRWLNEQLYTTSGSQSFETFQKDPSLFSVYHSGFQLQVDKWPVNPLDEMIRYVSSLPKSKIIADFGCGEARLAQSVPHKVHSFDLHSSNPHVIACDISDVPLDDESVDVVIFCLSLMGTNYLDFVREARRVLKNRGIVKIAEVKSRINEEAEIKRFVNQIKHLGFKHSSTDSNNKMFISFQFTKTEEDKSSSTKEEAILKPCIYKRR